MSPSTAASARRRTIKVRPGKRGMVTSALAGALGLVVALGLSGCRPGGRSADTDAPTAIGPTSVVAQVGESAITVAALQRELARRGLQAPSARDRAAVLEDLIRFEALFAQAKREGLDQAPEAQAAFKNLVVSRYREQLAAKQKPARTVTEADIQGFYQANVERYRVNERVNAAMIHLPLSWKATPERRAELTQLADRLRAQAEAAAGDRPSFGLLALTNSAHQASRYRGGELGWLDRQAASQTFEPAVVEAMFALPQPGVVSAVVTGRDGLYLFRLMERKPASTRPLSEVRDEIAHVLARDLAAQQESALYAQAKAGLSIQVNERVLERMAPTASGNQPPPPAMPRR